MAKTRFGKYKQEQTTQSYDNRRRSSSLPLPVLNCFSIEKQKKRNFSHVTPLERALKHRSSWEGFGVCRKVEQQSKQSVNNQHFTQLHVPTLPNYFDSLEENGDCNHSHQSQQRKKTSFKDMLKDLFSLKKKKMKQPRAERPVMKLSVKLLETYKNINDVSIVSLFNIDVGSGTI